ncbi:MAG: hypothetical protein ABIV25_16020 [Paracoccaceae bacterium]
MSAVEKEAQGSGGDAGNTRGELLARLSTDPRKLAIERRSLPATVEDRLSAILTEIDEIVLPRQLHLYSAAREVARLTVSHRRLISIEMPGRLAASKDSSGLADLFAARLVEIAEMPGALSLTASHRPTPPNQPETACSVAALNQALAFATTQNAFDRLLRQVAPYASARLVWSEKNPQGQHTGPPEWSGQLRNFTETYRAMGRDRRSATRVTSSRTEGVAIPLNDDVIVMIASLEKKGFAAILPRSVGLDLISAWQSY